MPPNDSGMQVDAHSNVDASFAIDASTRLDAAHADAHVMPDVRTPPDGQSVTLLTYNVAGLPALVSDENPERNIPLISPMLNRYGTILVQEDFAYHRSLTAAIDHAFRSEHNGVPEGQLPGLGQSYGDGLNRFSRTPFRDHRRVVWTQCNGLFDSGSDCFTQKGFSAAVHMFAGTEVLIYNLHMDAGRDSADANARRTQMEQLLADMEQQGSNLPVVVLGDTNMKSGDEAMVLEFLERGGLTDACRATSCATPELHDRVMYRGGGGVDLRASMWSIDDSFVDSAGEPLSDHHAIVVQLTW